MLCGRVTGGVGVVTATHHAVASTGGVPCRLSPHSCCHPPSGLACPLPHAASIALLRAWQRSTRSCRVGIPVCIPTASSAAAPCSEDSPAMPCPSCLHPGAHRFSNTPTSSPSCFGLCWWQCKHLHLPSAQPGTLFRRTFGVTGTAGRLPASNPHFAVHCQRMQPPASVPSAQPISLLRTSHFALQPSHDQAATSLLPFWEEASVSQEPVGFLPTPEETTNPCVFPPQGPSQTQLLSRTRHRHRSWCSSQPHLTTHHGLFYFTMRNDHPSG